MTKSSGFTPFTKQCFVTAAVCSNVIGHGCVVGFPAVLLPQLHSPGSLLTLTKEEDSWITSTMAFSLLAGNFITPSIMDRRGRRAAHLAVALPAIISWLTTVMATSFQLQVIARILGGLSFGMLLPLRSVLVGEYTSPTNRGAFLTTVALAQAFGIFFVHLIGSLLDWQKTALICVFFPFTSFVMTIYSPESPSYLAARGNYDECRKVFRWLRGDDEEQELEEMIEARIIFDKTDHKIKNFREVLVTIKKKEFYKPIVIMVHANALMQFAGGSTMAAYSTVILGLILGSEANAHFWMIALDAQRILSNTLAIFVINRYKRRTMMFSTGGLCVVSHIAIAGYVCAKMYGYLAYDAMWVPILLINIQFFTVGVGIVPLPNVIAGEVFPLQYRSLGGSISMISLSVFTFVVLKTFPGLTDSIGLQGTYFVYAGALTYFLVVIWIFLPETKDRTLQQIEDEFRGAPLPLEERQARESLADVHRKMSVMSVHSINVMI